MAAIAIDIPHFLFGKLEGIAERRETETELSGMGRLALRGGTVVLTLEESQGGREIFGQDRG